MLFQMETRVSLKYFVNGCSKRLKEKFVLEKILKNTKPFLKNTKEIKRIGKNEEEITKTIS